MAKGTWREQFRYVIYDINGALPDAVVLAVGYKTDAAVPVTGEPLNDGSSDVGTLSYFKDIRSYSQCLTEMVAQLNAFQRMRDCRAEMYCQPFGHDADQPVRALTAGEKAEQRLVSIDGVEKGWKRAINLANRDANGAYGAVDDQLPEDVA